MRGDIGVGAEQDETRTPSVRGAGDPAPELFAPTLAPIAPVDENQVGMFGEREFSWIRDGAELDAGAGRDVDDPRAEQQIANDGVDDARLLRRVAGGRGRAG